MWRTQTFLELVDHLSDAELHKLEIALAALYRTGIPGLKEAERLRGSFKQGATSIEWLGANDWVYRTPLFYIRCSILEGMIAVESFHMPKAL
jgi:hypothetical protein